MNIRSLAKRLVVYLLCAFIGLLLFSSLFIIYLSLSADDWSQLLMLITYSLPFCWVIVALSVELAARVRFFSFIQKIFSKRSILVISIITYAIVLGIGFAVAPVKDFYIAVLGYTAMTLSYTIGIGLCYTMQPIKRMNTHT